ncbi:chondroadherin-like protein isoform X2 [Ambystoma mexicanum]|uniref:chondroadherin-like protein isoform X2 n=1 Tax=Ambystoma mexicanum TaxID=8296 RepID=UPI0037E707E6
MMECSELAALRTSSSMQYLLATLLLAVFWGTPVSGATCPRFCICDNLKSFVTCMNKNLSQVPASAIPQLTQKLDIRGNNIKVIPSEAFFPIPYLTHLNLQKCGIETLEEGAFRGLGRLTYLNLGSNAIAFILQETFDGLTSLKQLVLEKNRLEEISPGAFSQLGFLNLLDLGDNFLVYLPDMVFQGLQQIKWIRISHNMLNILADHSLAGMPTLQRLSLDHNELQYLPNDALSKLPGVTRLDLGGNPMTFIGEDALQMPALKQLFLDGMSLQDVSFLGFHGSPQLALLDLRDNQLRVLQPLAGLRQLRRIELTGNPVLCDCNLRPFKEWAEKARIRAEVTCAGPSPFQGERLDAMRGLDMRCDRRAPEEEEEPVTLKPTADSRAPCPSPCHCQPDPKHVSCENQGLLKIPQGFPTDTGLLDLRRNEFGTVPAGAFPNLVNMVSLHLQSCGIEELQPGALRGLKGLVYLYLSNNRLSSLSAAALEGAPHLTYLHLEHNRFTRVPRGAFAPLPGLLSLHLQYNAIRQLTDNNMEGARALRWLYLSGNNIESVAPTALAAARQLEKLHLDQNLLSEVPTNALRAVPGLQELKLSKNPIRYIRGGAFQPVTGSLHHLHLDHLGLEKFSETTFSGLGHRIKTLHLEGNKLQNLPEMSKFTGLEVVNLSDNPFQCDCQLLPLRRWIDRLNLKVGATCGSPQSVRGRKVKDAPFKGCPGWGSASSKSIERPKNTPTPKPTATRSGTPKAAVKPSKKKRSQKPRRPVGDRSIKAP